MVNINSSILRLSGSINRIGGGGGNEHRSRKTQQAKASDDVSTKARNINGSLPRARSSVDTSMPVTNLHVKSLVQNFENRIGSQSDLAAEPFEQQPKPREVSKERGLTTGNKFSPRAKSKNQQDPSNKVTQIQQQQMHNQHMNNLSTITENSENGKLIFFSFVHSEPVLLSNKK